MAEIRFAIYLAQKLIQIRMCSVKYFTGHFTLLYLLEILCNTQREQSTLYEHSPHLTTQTIYRNSTTPGFILV